MACPARRRGGTERGGSDASPLLPHEGPGGSRDGAALRELPLAALERIDQMLAAAAKPQPRASWCPHEATPKQATFLAVDGLEALYGGAAGGGKSDALLMAALQHVDRPGYSAILFRRTYTDLALPGALMDRAHEWLDGTEARWHGTERLWRFPSSATLAFGYLDTGRDHLRYQGAEFQFIGFDELTQFEERQYRYLFSRLRRAGVDAPLRMRAASNPGDIGHEWVKQRFLGEPGDRIFVPATLEDNPHLDRVAYERSLAELDPITRRQLRHGEWVRDSTGLVYHAFSDLNRAHKLPRLQREEEWSHVLGIDYGFTDETAIVALAFAEHVPELYVLRSTKLVGATPSDAAEIVRRWDQELVPDRIVGDTGGLGKGYAEEARQRFGLPIEPAQKQDKLGYIRLMNGDLANRRLLLLPGNEELEAELRALAWQDERHQHEHPGLANHLCDALLYGWREARHWQWNERRDPILERGPGWVQQRKARLIERNQRAQDENDDSWILGSDS